MRAKFNRILAILGICLISALGSAEEPKRQPAGRDLYVDPDKGNDSADGLLAIAKEKSGPVKTIARAIRLAQAGDTVHLAPMKTPYHESAIFYDRSGEPGKPITLDGHGNTITGCEPLNLADWQMTSAGLYRNDHLLRVDDAVLMRWFFRFDGKMNHMSRSSKGPSEPLKKVAELKPGEWTFVKEEQAFYIKIDPGKKLGDYRIEAPVRGSGVVVAGNCNHLVIRNITATHVYNDGYNIHGVCRDVKFENIQAIECGDDGFSAHDDCQVEVDGFVSIGNSTGLCNTGKSESKNNRLLLRDNIGFDFFLIGTNAHTLTNSVLLCSSAQPVMVVGERDKTEPCTLEIDNVFIQNRGGPNFIRLYSRSIVEASRLTLDGFSIVANGQSLSLRHSVIGGKPPCEITLYPGLDWKADHNAYDIGHLRIDKTFYTQKNWAEYVKASKQDASSELMKLAFKQPVDGSVASPKLPPGVGVDPKQLPKFEGDLE